MPSSSPQDRIIWFQNGLRYGHAYLIRVRYGPFHDYPEYASTADLHDIILKIDATGFNRVCEVFDLSLSENRIYSTGYVRDDRSYRPFGYT